MIAQNRRRHTRYAFTIAITLFQNENTIRCSECRNISRGGMCVILSENTFLEGTLHVALSKMIGDTLIDFKAECRVAWQDHSGSYDNARMLGLEFLSIDHQNSYNLERILAATEISPQEMF
jgi:c-di-GMP-binding flagellar brake protein YcgR